MVFPGFKFVLLQLVAAAQRRHLRLRIESGKFYNGWIDGTRCEFIDSYIVRRGHFTQAINMLTAYVCVRPCAKTRVRLHPQLEAEAMLIFKLSSILDTVSLSRHSNYCSNSILQHTHLNNSIPLRLDLWPLAPSIACSSAYPPSFPGTKVHTYDLVLSPSKSLRVPSAANSISSRWCPV